MELYVAEIGGEAILAFRAEDDDEAYESVHDELFWGLLRADGKTVLWDGESEISVRRASADEYDRWNEISEPDDHFIFLIPVRTTRRAD